MNATRLLLASILSTLVLTISAAGPDGHGLIHRTAQVGKVIVANKYGKQLVASGTLLLTARVLSKVMQPASHLSARGADSINALMIIIVSTNIISDNFCDALTEFLERMDGHYEEPLIQNDEPPENNFGIRCAEAA